VKLPLPLPPPSSPFILPLPASSHHSLFQVPRLAGQSPVTEPGRPSPSGAAPRRPAAWEAGGKGAPGWLWPLDIPSVCPAFPPPTRKVEPCHGLCSGLRASPAACPRLGESHHSGLRRSAPSMLVPVGAPLSLQQERGLSCGTPESQRHASRGRQTQGPVSGGPGGVLHLLGTLGH